MEKKLANEDQMHGSMFVLLRRYVENTYDFSTWIKLLEAAGIAHEHYQMQEVYPTKEMFAIIDKASELTGITVYELLENYGEFLVSDLLLVYNRYINPSWRTYDMLLNTEAAMHAAVKRENNRANPPMLLVTKKGSKQLIVDYHSRRKMASVAVGIIRGIAGYFHEKDIVEVTLLTPADKERVQIRVDFLGDV
ncbi:heme NO-binding domain-containing protein [Pontibacter pamirensis]|uniref:heme NO-binding domain-containing protein n=1 Tax=Pontibacter pamirensis TaxID=2562824 RepID=UPI00138974D1|nr:heme NO-binding domain-containing protein [Pontibacter pamirensis]